MNYETVSKSYNMCYTIPRQRSIVRFQLDLCLASQVGIIDDRCRYRSTMLI